MEFIGRELTGVLKQSLETFPSVLLTGARRSGKSTLFQHMLVDSPTLNLDFPTVRANIQADPSWLAPRQHTLILDEIQKQPELLEILKAYIDGVPQRRGLYAVTGSEQFRLMRGVRESLAGRIAIHTLWPLSWNELHNADVLRPDRASLMELMVRGGYPSLWVDRRLSLSVWMQSYVDTYLERDVELHFGVTRIPEFIRLVELLAARTGQLLNISELGRDCRVADTTIREWISILERSYIVQLIQPWHANLSKRAVKMPKVFFVDTGLLCYFLGIDSSSALERHPSRGSIFENFIFSELIKTLSLDSRRSSLFFYRTHDGQEIDFILERGGQRIGVEAKYAEMGKPQHDRHLRQFLAEGLLHEAYLVSTGEDLKGLVAGGLHHLPWHQLSRVLRSVSAT